MRLDEEGPAPRGTATSSATAGAPVGEPGAVDEAATPRGFLVMLLVLTFAMNTIGRGVAETFAVFLLPVERDLDVSRSAMTATYSLYMLVTGLMGPFAGQLIDRFGARITYGLGLVVMGSGYFLAGSATEIWHYYLTVGVVGGLGTCLLGMVIASSLLTRWFSRRLGAVIALPYAAIGMGMLLFPPLTQLLLEAYGWRFAHQVLGLGILTLLPFVMLLPLRRMSQGSAQWRRIKAESAMVEGKVWDLRAAIATGAFWAMFGVFFTTSIAAYAVLPQSVAFLIERGFDPLLAAGSFGLIGVMSTFGILAMGALSDRIGRLKAATLSYFSSFIGLFSLLMVAFWPSLALVYSFVFFFGMMQGARGPLVVAMIPVIFKGGNVGAIFGAMSLGQGIGGAVGSWTSGLLHDLSGDYIVSILFGIAASVMGLLLFWVVPSLRHERIGGAPDVKRTP